MKKINLDSNIISKSFIRTVYDAIMEEKEKVTLIIWLRKISKLQRRYGVEKVSGYFVFDDEILINVKMGQIIIMKEKANPKIEPVVIRVNKRVLTKIMD